jgi:hypothetical protein
MARRGATACAAILMGLGKGRDDRSRGREYENDGKHKLGHETSCCGAAVVERRRWADAQQRSIQLHVMGA